MVEITIKKSLCLIILIFLCLVGTESTLFSYNDTRIHYHGRHILDSQWCTMIGLVLIFNFA